MRSLGLGFRMKFNSYSLDHILESITSSDPARILKSIAILEVASCGICIP
jgi:hypothetical protein